ncbi:MAG TPA: hypothetical protein ENJ82_05915, partial [Bacteroidetes bacterium]|nr:hypothetical protein [Bacteroidota bacterium]
MKKRSLILVSLCLIVVAGFASIFLSKPEPQPLPPDMIHFTPGESYLNDWQRVDSLEKKGLVKSALELVNGIYDKAAAEKNQAQQVKSLFHILKYTQQVQETPMVKNISRLESEIEKAAFPLKPLLQSVLADQFWSYYMQNQWRFQNRSETVGIDEKDIETWDLRKIVDRVTGLH